MLDQQLSIQACGLGTLRVLPTFAGVLRKKKMRTHASFKSNMTNYISQ